MAHTTQASNPPARPFRGAGLLLALLALLPVLTACAGRTPAPAPAATPPASAAEKAPAPAPPATSDPQPPDGKWLSDDKGDKYFLRTYPKQEGSYLRLPDGRLRLVGGATVVVDHEDDKLFYYRVYRAPDWVPADRRGPSAEEQAKVAATYVPQVGESDRLRFEPFGTGLPTRGQWRDGFDLADMDGDGHLDLVHGPARKSPGPPVVFLGDGQGNWKRWSGARFPDLAYDYGDAAAGDLDGDGHPDIALGIHLEGLMALAGDGKGEFRDWGKGLDFQVPGKGGDAGGFSSRSILLADWNGDRRLDILALGEGARLNVSSGQEGEGARPGASSSYGPAVYLNQGDGTWVKRGQGTSGQAVSGVGLAVADFDGDGRLDFATGSNATGRKDLLNLGQPDGTWKPTEIPLLRPGILVDSVAAADFDGDGRPELVVGYLAVELGRWRTGIDLFHWEAREGNGEWSRRPLAAVEDQSDVTALATGDLDADGHLDLVALTGYGETWVFTGDGKGSFTRQKAPPPAYPGACSGYHVRLADLDGRPGDEIVASFAGEGNALFSTGMALPGIKDRSCPTQGGFQAWRAVAAKAAAH